MRTKSIMLLGLMIVLLLPYISAEPVSVELIESNGDIEVGDAATFKLIITNNQEERDVFRIGGDEFLIHLVGDCNKSFAEQIAEKLIVELSRSYTIEGQSIQIGCSIGIAMYPDHDIHFDGLVRQADSAMYKAKRLGKNQFTVAES